MRGAGCNTNIQHCQVAGVEAEAEATLADGSAKGGVLPKLRSEAAAVSGLLASFKGREYLMDPRIFNHRRLAL
jgi:hypothetical protein